MKESKLELGFKPCLSCAITYMKDKCNSGLLQSKLYCTDVSALVKIICFHSLVGYACVIIHYILFPIMQGVVLKQ